MIAVPVFPPTKSDKVPTGPEWIHEIKYDGYRMMLIRDHDRVRLISRGGRDWADRFTLIVSAALKLPLESFVLDGEVIRASTRTASLSSTRRMRSSR
jgi:bifunctional non-homologous end joining protein LigD